MSDIASTPTNLREAVRLLLGEELCLELIADQWNAVNDLGDPYDVEGHSARFGLSAASLGCKVLDKACLALAPEMSDLLNRRMAAITEMQPSERDLHFKSPAPGNAVDANEPVLPEIPASADHTAELEAEIERLHALMDGRFKDVNLVSFVDGVMSFDGALIPVIAEFLAQMLQGQDKLATPANYVEMQFTHPDMGSLTLNLQRDSGQTPHQLRRAAEAEVARLQAALDAATVVAEDARLQALADDAAADCRLNEGDH